MGKRESDGMNRKVTVNPAKNAREELSDISDYIRSGKLFTTLAVLGLITFCTSLYYYNLHNQSQSWPTVEGFLMDAYVTGPIGDHRKFFPSVRYQYRVDGKRYISKKLSHQDQEFSSRYEALDYMGNLNEVVKSHRKVQVYYNPDDSSQAVLKISTPTNLPYYLFGSLLLFVLAGGIRIAIWIYRRKNPESDDRPTIEIKEENPKE